MDYDYVIDVVTGKRACIAGIARYSAVHAYITAVWAYYSQSCSPVNTNETKLQHRMQIKLSEFYEQFKDTSWRVAFSFSSSISSWRSRSAEFDGLQLVNSFS